MIIDSILNFFFKKCKRCGKIHWNEKQSSDCWNKQMDLLFQKMRRM
jgi:hypothetical protein